MAERVAVGPCRCPGTPHPGGDWVDLYSEVSVALGVAVRQAASSGGDAMAVQVALSRAFLRYGIAGWSFVDADGPVATTQDLEVIDRWLPYARGGMEVVERADALYSNVIFDPLLRRMPAASPAGPTASSTSPIPLNGHRRRKHSAPSSRLASAGGKRSGVPAP